ncbi:MAG: hypothetical protein WD969_17365 [Paracoccaceae bacterium]
MNEKTQETTQCTQTVTPHIVVEGAAEAIAFYARAFGAHEKGAGPDGPTPFFH